MGKIKKSTKRKPVDRERNKNSKRLWYSEDRNSKTKSKARELAKQGNYQDAAEVAEASKFEDKFPIKFAKHASNDPQWYYKQDALLNDVASFSYMKPLGRSVNRAKDAPAANYAISAMNTIPGVMAITLVPTVGVSTNASSPLNLAAQNIYTRVRYKNSGAKNYDAPDLMLYYIAMSSVYSAWNWAKRIYGYASTYSAVNMYKPLAYAKAENVNLSNIQANLAQFRAKLNMLANEINSFCVPAVFNYMVRQSWLYSNIYMDSDTTKAQEYMFTPACFYKYDETTSPQGGILIPVNVNLTSRSDEITYDAIINMIKSMIDALQYSEDIGVMSGDTLKEFEGKLFTLSQIDPDFRVDAVFDKEVMTQIENLTWQANWATRVPSTNINNVWTIRQDPNTNFLKFQPAFVSSRDNRGKDAVYLNFHWDNPTPADTMVASRINVMTTSLGRQSDGDHLVITDCGSEIAIDVSVIYFATGDITEQFTNDTKLKLYKYSLESITFGNIDATDALGGWVASAIRCAKTVMLWSAFDWAPAIYSYINLGTASGSKYYMLPDLKDWDVFTRIESEQLTSMNSLALLSLFDVPSV